MILACKNSMQINGMVDVPTSVAYINRTSIYKGQGGGGDAGERIQLAKTQRKRKCDQKKK